MSYNIKRVSIYEHSPQTITNISLILLYFFRFMRKDMLTFGQFSLNLTNVPQREGYISQLYKIIERIVAKSHLLPFTLENMNTLALTPK